MAVGQCYKYVQKTNKQESVTKVKKRNNFIMRWAQRQLGTAQLEEKSVPALFKGVWSRLLSAWAMSPLPLIPSFRVFLQRRRGVNIGNHVFLGCGCWLDSVRPDLITIEDHVSLAGSVTILTHSDPTEPLRDALGSISKVIRPVTIKRGAWITVNVTILPGVTIGENSIVSAGSVVTKDIPPNVLAQGNPATVVRELPDLKKRNSSATPASDEHTD